MRRRIKKVIITLKEKDMSTWLDKLRFYHIFILWGLIVVFFGTVYHFSKGSYSYLMYSAGGSMVSTLSDSIYFSFITATTTGFGDVVPIGLFKIIAIIEVICGLLLLALVTSKLVSIKQDVIIDEIYDISFNERINRLRSSLLVFRQNINRMINRTEEKSIKKREIGEIYLHASSLKDILNEILSLITRPTKKQFTKGLDPLNRELIYNSMIQSFVRLNELINSLNEHKLEWKNDYLINLIYDCISINRVLIEKIESEKTMNENSIAEIIIQNNETIELLKKNMNTSVKIKSHKDLKHFI